MIEKTLAEIGGQVRIRPRYDNFIGGQWVAPVKGQYFSNLTPVTGKPICEIARSTAEDVELALDAAIRQGNPGRMHHRLTVPGCF